MTRAAALDLGTNTFRLLIGEVTPGARTFDIIEKQQIITRLGGGFTEGGALSTAAQDRALNALSTFAASLQRHNVGDNYRAVATSIMRRAADSEAFAARVLGETGLRLEVISGEEEARLMLSGVAAGLARQDVELPGPCILYDIGGGSTEYVATRSLTDNPPQPAFLKSYALGVVTLAEAHLHTDPPGADDIAAMRDSIGGTLAAVARDVEEFLSDSHGGGRWTLVGTAGTITSLAIVAQGLDTYEVARVTGYRLGRDRVQRIFARLAGMTAAERGGVFPLGGGREDVILPGALITETTMAALACDTLVVADEGLLEGVLIASAYQGG